MIIGFTGTRNGMSRAQKEQLMFVLTYLVPLSLDINEEDQTEFHHGGAEGADTEADGLANLRGFAIVIHPCPGVVTDAGGLGSNGNGRFKGHNVLRWEPVLPPLVRDKNIAKICDVLIAAPKSDKEEIRSGTWATVRYAREALKPVIILSRGTEK